MVPLTIGGRLIIPHPLSSRMSGRVGDYFASLEEKPFIYNVCIQGIDDSSTDFGGYFSLGTDFWLNPRAALNFEGKYHWFSRRSKQPGTDLEPRRVDGSTSASGSPSEKGRGRSAPGPPPRRIRGIRPPSGHVGGEALLPARPDAVRPFQPRPLLRERRFPFPLPLAARREGVREDRAVRELPRQHLRREVPGGDTDRRLDGAGRDLPEGPARRPGPPRRPPRLHPEPPVDLLRGEGDRLHPPGPGFLRTVAWSPA